MMKFRTDVLSSAIENIDTAYLEETLAFEAKVKRAKRARRFPKLSAACLALLLILGFSATAFAISRIPLSWRDIFPSNQAVIDDDDESPIISEQHTNVDTLKVDVVKAISDERMLYLLYSVKANDSAVLNPEGRFAAFDLYFPDKMMSGAYQQHFLPRKGDMPENELEGVIYADWQADTNAKSLVMTFSNWQDTALFDSVKVDFNVAELVATSGENAKLPTLYTGHMPQYLWQPSDTSIPLPYGGVSICSAGWEDGILQLVMKGPKAVDEWSTGTNWYFIDTRTNTILYPEQHVTYRWPDELDQNASNDWCYFWNFVSVSKDALPYLEMYWGGKEVFTTVLTGEWTVTVNETPVTVQSELLAENVPLFFSGEEFLAKRIECSKLSMAVYFADYVDPNTGIGSAFKIFDANGDSIPCDWGFTADQTDDSCMFWTRFREPIVPESICKMTFNGEIVFSR